MEPESSLPYSQVPANCPYPEPTPSSLHNTLPLLKIRLNIILPFTSGSLHWSLSLRFSHQNPVHTLITLSDTKRHIHTHKHVVGFLWTRDQPVVKNSTWQNTIFASDRKSLIRRDSKPQFQQASGRRPKPYTARPPGSAIFYLGV
jgi:hypothetical protein